MGSYPATLSTFSTTEEPLAARSAAASSPTQLEQLQAEFRPEEHKSVRKTKSGPELTYIGIDATINRVNAVLGANWSVVPPTATRLMPFETTGMTEDGPVTRRTFLAVAEVYIQATIDGDTKTLYGVGAMEDRDPDMAAKTALAEGIKKAWHQAGVALYLWDPEARAAVERKKRLAGGSEAALKQEVWKIAKERLGKDRPTAAEVATVFDVKPNDLADADTLRQILVREGML